MNSLILNRSKSVSLKILLTTTTVLVSMVFSTLSYAVGKNHSSIEWAKVTRTAPITRTVEFRTPEKNCWTEKVQYRESYEPDRSYTGTILGGIIGGAVGNAVGHKKKNKKIGTAVGAILGASIGSDISSRSHVNTNPTLRYKNEQRCDINHQVSYEEEVVGYHVWYRYHGETYKTRMDHKPGRKIKVRVVVKPL